MSGQGDHPERDVQRPLQLTTPQIHGPDVKKLQEAAVNWLAHVELPHPRLSDFGDGQFDPQTRRVLNRTATLLGLDPVGAGPAGPVFTKEEQLLIRDPSKRTAAQKERSVARVEDALAKLSRHRGGAAKAVKAALDQKGTTEHPPGSNLGEPVETWTRFCGLTPPVFWCGCFAAYMAVHEGGAKSTPGAMVHNQYMLNYARAGQYGLEDVTIGEAEPGDILSYSFAHIGMLVDRITGSGLHTIEGNTSPEGQANNGGGVYEHTGATRNTSMLLGIIRPAYAG